MKERYVRAMEALHRLCMLIAGACLVVITLIIPWGVFRRYVLNDAASWPEPVAVLLMIWFSFMSAAICYRENLHIAVAILPNALTGTARVVLGLLVEACMISISLFMLYYGTNLVATTWYQVIAELPFISTGVAYLPVPLGGAIVALFVIERVWTGRFFEQPSDSSISAVTTQ
ncbi:MAG TPA: TRAP transporter small permease [Hyphomicrobiaceae bacterium]|nr:TRAP transporter small permease [Hyphomicrobiaceae bacterium]